MRKLLVVCLVLIFSFVGTSLVFGEKKEEETPAWLEEKSFHPPQSNAAMSKLAFVDFMNQWIGVTGEDAMETAESIGYLPDFKANERSAIKKEEAEAILSHLFPMADWPEASNGNKPVKLKDAIQYVESLADQTYTTGTYSNQTVEGNALINQPGVTLEDTTIEGDLYITRGIGTEQTILDSVTVHGTVYVEKSVQNAVKLKDSDIGLVSVYTLGGEKSDWSLVWGDEFLTEEIDSSKWKHDIGNWIVDEDGEGISPGWGNNELEYYTDSEENSYIEDGNLVIKAKEEQKSDEFGSYDYTSAKLKTE
ncbi:glycoside hydrolase family 16 protein [Salimicrobium halophilum]|uniref:SLH domain-containing protein n=1 Tax=Salimicrobium halophilum TaxID=86666 RepID=A0A1G8UP04_9BACI|nr:hypothetical protein [Salimicrobium halophilum]SDJ55374.1 hypothetical protein SAMN04490247_2298 [Salimicrobium halophilum]